MSLFHQKTTFGVIVFMLCSAAAVILNQSAEIPMISLPSTSGQCLHYDDRQAVQDLLLNSIIYPFFNGSLQPESQCGPGLWRRVFYLNASEPSISCPGQWNVVTSSVTSRGCSGANSSCISAFSDYANSKYSKVCGRIIGEGSGSPDAFHRFISNQTTIEGIYLDGVSVTHGDSGSRTHIWSFGAGHPAVGGRIARCPCDNSNRGNAPLPPAEVGDNYFCYRANGLDPDPLWTGENCTSDNPCCSFNNPPYFSVQLPAATTDRIEIRICSDQLPSNEPVLVLFAEIYVQ